MIAYGATAAQRTVNPQVTGSNPVGRAHDTWPGSSTEEHSCMTCTRCCRLVGVMTYAVDDKVTREVEVRVFPRPRYADTNGTGSCERNAGTKTDLVVTPLSGDD